MAADHILTLDAGTSGGRCVILRPATGVVAVARETWDYDTSPEIGPFGRSFDPEAMWSVLCRLATRALADAGISAADVAVAATTSQRQGIVVVDGEGSALMAGPNIDARAIAQGLAIDGAMLDRVYASNTKLPSLLMAPARLQWLGTNDVEAFRRAKHCLTIGDWLAYRLTGVPMAERSLAADTGLLDVSTRERDDALLNDLDIPHDLLPPLVDAGVVIGQTTSRAAGEIGLRPGTPVAIGGADTQCALYGMGIEELNELGIAAGWSVTALLVTPHAIFDTQRRTWTDVHARPDRWLVESSCSDAGNMWRWWAETVGGSLEEASQLAARAAPGSGEVLAHFGPAAMDATAMGPRLGGLVMYTPLTMTPLGKPELLRAALENIAFALRSNVTQAEGVAGVTASRIAVGGGMTQAVVFPRILADVLNRPIEVAGEVQVTACGAARFAAMEAGLPDEGLQSPLTAIEPDPSVGDTYERSYGRWRSLREVLDANMQELS
jgi:autoinducer 2 (AI-2) kinase